MPRATVSENLEAILSPASVPEAEKAAIYDAFFLCDALTFAKYLHRTDSVTDKVKGELLALKVRTPNNPADREKILEDAMNDAMAALWSRIGSLANG
jgi:hypothetical protein